MAIAAQHGFTSADPDWCNLGQGQPEIGDIEGAPVRSLTLTLEPTDWAYGPVLGIDPLRDAVANEYNRLYRGKVSPYAAANVAIAAGGRVALSRTLAALGRVRLGYQTPDYPAYEELLQAHADHVTAVHVPMHEHGRVSPERLVRAIREKRLDACLLSNPCNPTGQLIEGHDLQACVDAAREERCLLILDEFYSHIIYTDTGAAAVEPVSAARYVTDVERDPVVIIDGLTNNFRRPGWRVAWTVGPSEVIERIGGVAATFDGGVAVPMQRAVLELLGPGRAEQEAAAVRVAFARKRQLTLEMLAQMGVSVPQPPRGAFYIWGNLARLPRPYNDAAILFREALKHKVVVVPGYYFDVNPGEQRPADDAYSQWMRFSFGPSEQCLRLGLTRLRELMEQVQNRPGVATPHESDG